MIYKKKSLLKFKIMYMMGVYCLTNFLGRQIYHHMSFDEYVYFPPLFVWLVCEHVDNNEWGEPTATQNIIFSVRYTKNERIH